MGLKFYGRWLSWALGLNLSEELCFEWYIKRRMVTVIAKSTLGEMLHMLRRDHNGMNTIYGSRRSKDTHHLCMQQITYAADIHVAATYKKH